MEVAALSAAIAAVPAILSACALLVKMILGHLENQRAAFEQFMGNHISHMARSVEENSKAIEANTLVLREVARRAATDLKESHEAPQR